MGRKGSLAKTLPMCIPCDETRYKKPIGTKYNKAGTCEYESGVYLLKRNNLNFPFENN